MTRHSPDLAAEWDAGKGITVRVMSLEGRYWWRAVACNGETVASGETHSRKWSAKRAARRLFPPVKS